MICIFYIPKIIFIIPGGPLDLVFGRESSTYSNKETT